MKSPTIKNTDYILALDKLKQGMAGVITELHSNIDKHPQIADILRRLQELGFVAGERVRVLQRGVAGGQPIAVRIGSSTFALRGLEASMILVTPES